MGIALVIALIVVVAALSLFIRHRDHRSYTRDDPSAPSGPANEAGADSATLLARSRLEPQNRQPPPTV